MLACVGRMRIASTTSNRSTPTVSAKRPHSSISAMVVARNVFSITFAVSDAVVLPQPGQREVVVLMTVARNASAALAAASV